MNKQRFASQTSLMNWAGTDQYYALGNIMVVPKNNMFYYFSLDTDNWFNLVMSSERNLAEGE